MVGAPTAAAQGAVHPLIAALGFGGGHGGPGFLGPPVHPPTGGPGFVGPPVHPPSGGPGFLGPPVHPLVGLIVHLLSQYHGHGPHF